MRKCQPPIIPKIKDKYDTSNFDPFDEEPVELNIENGARKHWPAFTFKSPALWRLMLGTWGRGMTSELGREPVNLFMNSNSTKQQ